MTGDNLSLILWLSIVFFLCGFLCMIVKRNVIGMLIGVELILNAANLNFVAFAQNWRQGIDGQVATLFVIVLAAAEAAVALAIALVYYNSHSTIDADRGDSLRG